MVLSTKVVTLLLFLFAATNGTELLLKNGKSYSGKIVEETGTHIILIKDKKKFTIKKSAIAKKDGKLFQAELPLPRPADVKPLAPEKSTTEKAEEKQQQKSTEPWVVTLKNGTVFQGPKISENQRILVLESKGSPVSIFKNVIATIDSGKGGTVSSAKQKKEETRPPAKSGTTESASKAPEKSVTADAGNLTTIVVPKPRRKTRTKPITEVAAKNSAVVKKDTTKSGKTEKPETISSKKSGSNKKRGTSLADMMTVDVVSGDKSGKGTVKTKKLPKKSDSSASAEKKQKSTALPRPKARITVSSMNGDVQQPEEKPVAVTKSSDEVRVLEASEKQQQVSHKKKTAPSGKTAVVSPAPLKVKKQEKKAVAKKIIKKDPTQHGKDIQKDEPSEAAKMVDSDDIEQLQLHMHTVDPEGVAVFAHAIPVVQRIAPALAGF